MKSLLFTILAISLSFTIGYGQEKENIQITSLLGINAGATTGTGLSFRHWHNKFGVQVSGLPIKVNKKFDYSLGITGFYKIRERRRSNIFVYTGHTIMTENFYIINEINPIFAILSENNRNRNTSPDYNASLGFGAELGKNPLFTVMLGYGAFEIFHYDYLYPTIELGLHFKLK